MSACRRVLAQCSACCGCPFVGVFYLSVRLTVDVRLLVCSSSVFGLLWMSVCWCVLAQCSACCRCAFVGVS